MNSLYFSRDEFACECSCGFNTVDAELLEVLEDVRTHFGKPVIISSGCRCISHNHSVGGATKSQHLRGIAADIIVKDIPAIAIYAYLDEKYKDKYGLGKYRNWTHIDVRDGYARWNKTL